jgi:hypothetical protein
MQAPTIGQAAECIGVKERLVQYSNFASNRKKVFKLGNG